jgi:hypothetical protein
MKHEIIFTGHYALIVSDEKPIEGQYFLFTPYNLVFKTDSTEYGENAINTHGVEYVESFTDDRQFNVEYCKTVIGHRPLKDAPILEGVPLLPKFSKKDDVEKKSRDFVKYVGGSQEQRLAFIDGYLEAKETYKYTEEDLRKAIEMAITSKYEYKLEFYNQNEIIQSLQQPKRPKCFECEMEQLPPNESFGLDYGSFNLKPKTITNSQGQTELVGEYIYG